jgi:transcriptional regulator with XRE-family HTH domain
MRKLKNWTQEEMAEKLNMCVNDYTKIEWGDTNTLNPKLEEIAQLLGVELLELISANEKNVCLGNDNLSYNIIGSSTEIAFEIQKLKSDLEHKNEIIEFQKRDILRLEEMLELMKKAAQPN